MNAGDGVLLFLLVILAGRFALTGKGTVSGKLAAFLSIVIVAWLFIAANNHTAGLKLAKAGANGASSGVSGVSRFVNGVFATDPPAPSPSPCATVHPSGHNAPRPTASPCPTASPGPRP